MLVCATIIIYNTSHVLGALCLLAHQHRVLLAAELLKHSVSYSARSISILERRKIQKDEGHTPRGKSVCIHINFEHFICRWRLVVSEYNSVKARLFNSQTLLGTTNLTLYTINEATLVFI